MITTAFVKIWDKNIGAVKWDEERQLGIFEYEDSFRNLGWDLSPIKMAIDSGKRIFLFPELRPGRGSKFNTFKGLPGLLADILPDKYGNQLIDIWLARHGRPSGSMNPVEMLCFMGTRGMGALEFEPVRVKERKRAFKAEQMFRRMVFNVLARNCHDHTKNFAFRLRKNEKWELAPAYDICHAYRPDSMWVSQHALSISGKRKDISRSDVLNLASAMNIKKADKIVNEVLLNVFKWNEFAEETKVSSELRDSIFGTLILDF